MSKLFFVETIRSTISYVLIVLVGLAIGVGANYTWQWYQQPASHLTQNTSAHFTNVEQKVVVYTTKWCQFCKKTKALLTKHQIAFLERDIEAGDTTTDKLYQSIPEEGIPKLIVGDNIIIGYHDELIIETLKQENLI